MRFLAILSTGILILTASEDERHRTRGFLYQADAYMAKPYDISELTVTICNLCSISVPGV